MTFQWRRFQAIISDVRVGAYGKYFEKSGDLNFFYLTY